MTKCMYKMSNQHYVVLLCVGLARAMSKIENGEIVYIKKIMGNLTAIFQIITVELTITMFIYTISQFLKHHVHAEGISFPMMYYPCCTPCIQPATFNLIVNPFW